MPRSHHTQRRSAKAEAPKKHINGIIQLTRRGTGYLRWAPLDMAAGKPAAPEKEDIEIRTENLAGALNGDEVEVKLRGLFPRPTGEVVKIISRAKTEFVGTVKQGVVVPADIKFYRPIRIDGHLMSVNAEIQDSRSKIQEGTKVLVKLISFTGKEDPIGEVIEVLGRAGEHRVEMNAIVLENGFATEFPPEVAREAKEIEQNHAASIAAEIPSRADYRSTVTFTIDPPDAKDFDDALSVRELPNGEYEIGVHIADATFFVRPGTPLGNEAEKRATSVYLVDATIPMLPHELSGNVCSLREGEDRLTFSAVFRMNAKAEVLERRFEKSVINSNKRFTYEEAQKILDQAAIKDGPLLDHKGPSFMKELVILRDLARLMRQRREKEGAIDFGDNEVKFELDLEGRPIAVHRKQRIETNLLIEDFMLLANVEVARFISDKAKKVPEHGLVFLYRIHDQPKEDRIEELATFVRAVGYEFGHRDKKKYSAYDIRKLLKDIEGKPEESLIRTATLRTMAKAIYSTKNIGHFGLSFEHYTHFTSPIRRYPDMLVHRILASHLNGKPITRREFTHLEKLCIAASEQEARAANAERESVRYKQVEYMGGKIGQTFDGVISGVTDWGVYVEEKESAADGLVPVRMMKDDFYNYDKKSYSLVGQRTKKKLALGDKVRVKLVSADLAARQLEFALV